MGVAFSPDGQRLVSGSLDQTVRLWDARTGQQLRNSRGTVTARTAWTSASTGNAWRGTYLGQHGADLGHPYGAGGVHPQGTFGPSHERGVQPGRPGLASAPGTRQRRLWDAQTGQVVHTFEGLSRGDPSYLPLGISPDGVAPATAGSEDQTVKVWDTQTGQETLCLRGHTALVNAVCFSPDGSAWHASSDKTVKVWDAQTGRETFSLEGHTRRVGAVCFSPDGQRLASEAGSRCEGVLRTRGLARGF